MRRAAKIDSTAKALTALARQMGALVLPLNGVIDCLIYTRRGVLFAVDWKGPKTRRTVAQQKLTDAGFPLYFVSTPEQLTALVTK